jgi:hypothetical protein
MSNLPRNKQIRKQDLLKLLLVTFIITLIAYLSGFYIFGLILPQKKDSLLLPKRKKY